jgi:hypothetical protein
MEVDPTAPQWARSSYSQQGGNCVEWAPGHAFTGIVPVRDSKCPSGPILSFPVSAFSSFVVGVKDGHMMGAG